MKDKARVRITLESEQGGEKQVQQYDGEWFRKERTVYVRYVENDENYGEVRTLVRFREGELHVKRHGGVESELTYRAGNRINGKFILPQAQFAMETETSLLWVQSGDMTKEGHGPAVLLPTLPWLIEWHYSLWVEEQPAGDFKIRLRAEECE